MREEDSESSSSGDSSDSSSDDTDIAEINPLDELAKKVFGEGSNAAQKVANVVRDSLAIHKGSEQTLYMIGGEGSTALTRITTKTLTRFIADNPALAKATDENKLEDILLAQVLSGTLVQLGAAVTPPDPRRPVIPPGGGANPYSQRSEKRDWLTLAAGVTKDITTNPVFMGTALAGCQRDPPSDMAMQKILADMDRICELKKRSGPSTRR